MDRSEAIKLAGLRQRLASGEAQDLLARSGLSDRQVGSVCGVSGVAVLRWRRGTRRPTGRPALELADLLDALAKAAA